MWYLESQFRRELTKNIQKLLAQAAAVENDVIHKMYLQISPL